MEEEQKEEEEEEEEEGGLGCNRYMAQHGKERLWRPSAEKRQKPIFQAWQKKDTSKGDKFHNVCHVLAKE